MLIAFIDEHIKQNKFSLIMYVIDSTSTDLIDNKCEMFIKNNHFPTNIEFHYSQNAPRTRKLFNTFIKTLPLIKIYKSTNKYSKSSYYIAINEILSLLSLDFKKTSITPFMDEVGGPKEEMQIRKSFNESAQKYNIVVHKPLRFLPSHKSIFIQIADYLAATYNS